MNDAAPSARSAAGEALRQSKLIRHWNIEEKDLLRIAAVMDERKIDFTAAMIETEIASADEIANFLSPSTPLVRIGNEPLMPDQRWFAANDASGSRSEQVRALRTELLLRRRHNEGANTLALLSPNPGEGRSQLAAELAVAFAQLGCRTLLIDADMRKPALHKLFNATSNHGLSDALGNAYIPTLPAVHPVIGIPDLAVLLAGPLVVNALELLSSGSFARWMDHWRQEYEFIVIDTPPVSLFSDALAVATQVDSVLTLSRANQTPTRTFGDMIKRLAATRAIVLGAVINHF